MVNVGKYSIHGSYGNSRVTSCRIFSVQDVKNVGTMHLLTHQIVVKKPLICQTDSGDSLLLKPHPLPKKKEFQNYRRLVGRESDCQKRTKCPELEQQKEILRSRRHSRFFFWGASGTQGFCQFLLWFDFR